MVDAGRAAAWYQDRVFRNLNCKRIQVDEIWAFVYAKQKNVPHAKAAPANAGDVSAILITPCWSSCTARARKPRNATARAVCIGAP
jgi:hypothetical protein